VIVGLGFEKVFEKCQKTSAAKPREFRVISCAQRVFVPMAATPSLRRSVVKRCAYNQYHTTKRREPILSRARLIMPGRIHPPFPQSNHMVAMLLNRCPVCARKPGSGFSQFRDASASIGPDARIVTSYNCAEQVAHRVSVST